MQQQYARFKFMTISEYTMKVMCDDVATIFVDGEEKQVAGTQGWDQLATLQIPSSTRAIGVQCKDVGGGYGIMVGVQDAAGEDVVVSDTSWKCTESNVAQAVWSTGGFNEVNSWDEATELSSGLSETWPSFRQTTWQGMIPNAKIIWTNAEGVRTVFCRKDLPGDLFWTMMKHSELHTLPFINLKRVIWNFFVSNNYVVIVALKTVRLQTNRTVLKCGIYLYLMQIANIKPQGSRIFVINLFYFSDHEYLNRYNGSDDRIAR